jgi:hypothetical protein
MLLHATLITAAIAMAALAIVAVTPAYASCSTCDRASRVGGFDQIIGVHPHS